MNLFLVAHNTTVLAKQDGLFDKYASVALTEATTFMSFYNLNRLGFQNFNDGSVVSPQTANDANRTYNAMQNVHFRRALSFAYDRASSMAQRVGEELKLNALRNSYTPYNFVSLPEETTRSLFTIQNSQTVVTVSMAGTTQRTLRLN